MTREIAETLLAAFRTAPGRFAPAARAAGVSDVTAGASWHRGLKIHGFPQYARPFRDILADEQEATRARLVEAEEKAAQLAAEAEAHRRGITRDKAMQDVTEERKQEVQLVRSARAATIVLLTTVAQLSGGLNKLGQQVRVELDRQAERAANGGDVNIMQVMSMLTRLTTSLRQCNDAGSKAIEMSRLLLGEPTQIVGHQHLAGMSIAEARTRVEAARRALDDAEAAGQTTVGEATVGDPSLH